MTAPTIPTSAAELEAMLSDTSTLTAIAKTPASLGEFIRKYASAQMAKNGEVIEAQIREQSQIVVAEMLKQNGTTLSNRSKLDLGAGKSVTGAGAAYNPEAIGAALDSEFASVSDFLRSVVPDHKKSPKDRARWEKIRNDYSTVDPATGGFLVPEQLRSEILQNTLEESLVRPRAMVISMDGPSVPFPCVDETTHSGSVYGGITGTWVEEAEALPESEAKFGRIVLRANKLVSYCEVPTELPTDAPQAFGSFVDNAMPRAITFFEDSAFLTANGVGKPLGVLHSGNSALIAVAKESGQAADTIVWENVIAMFSRMLPSSLNRAVWIASIDSFPELATMALSVGTGGSAVWLNNGVEGPPATILGRPCYFTEKVNKVGDQGDLSFVDFGHYLVGDRQQMRVESSQHYKFGNDMIVYRVIERVDGRPWMKSAITPANGSTKTLSPYVTLAERA
ncbi:phage major capsid protein [Phytohabitans sp. ZYX-F-186]|uniref:Phage major capsid protein n=1 Tax=Phytohabitans maris TaxID=3071409 RepID=A0ABU0ZTX4_9ACTN|nr:phage major capsid protein [Phytohabitans sp. ZYX-F-186]MDQ7910251.1 phage major capsid protein [Phytohabitans sp. ZYX-F-186]